ncbi:MAG: TonB-dependent receptor [Ectothiorhodospiraceae bacterium]|nr:TonB-dependent receptor [Ectothiorhodospiraceae bacterium]
MNRNRTPVAVTAALCLMLPTLQAADPDGADHRQLDPLVITPDRSQQPLARTLNRVDVIDGGEISRRQAEDAGQLLRRLPGVDVTRLGGPGQQSSVFIRGANSQHTLVLLDGVSLNPGSSGQAALQAMHPVFLERVEVLRGPSASLYGSDAIGGTVNLITARPEAGTRALLGGGYGRYGREEQYAGLSVSDGEAYASARGLRQRVDGFPARVGADDDHAYSNDAGQIRAGFSRDDASVDLYHYQSEGTADYADFLLATTAQDYRNAVTRLSTAYRYADRLESRVIASRFRDDLQQVDSADFLRTERYALDWQNDLELAPGQVLSLGVQTAWQDVQAESFGTAYGVRERNNGYYLQHRGEIGRHQFRLAGRYVDHEAFDGRFTGDLGYGYALLPELQMHATVGSAYRAPDVTQRFGFGANPDLDPERSLSGELGLRWFPAPAHRVEMAVFQNDIKDLIDYDFTADQNRNLDRARIRGAELAYRYRTAEWLLGAGVAIQDARDREEGDRLLRRARRSGQLEAAYMAGPFTVGGEWELVGPRPDVGDVDVAGYGLLNLGAGWHPTGDFTLRLNLENVLDKDYTVVDGYNTPGRAVFLSARWEPRLR